jgi:hypothetical protein
MDRLTRVFRVVGCESRAGRMHRGRASTRLKPACEPLDGRQLLSTVATAPAVLPTPPATAVANAAADLSALDPTTFAQYQAEMAKAEGHSRVTVAQARKLAQDEAAIDQAVDAAGLDANTTSGDINRSQDWISTAFIATTYQADGWENIRQELQVNLAGVRGVTPLINRTIA